MGTADLLGDLSPVERVLLILLVVGVAHLAVRGIRALGELFVRPPGADAEAALRAHPRVATTITVVVSGLTFTIYFAGIGFVLQELGVPWTAYFASASVIGLAVGFGSQGLVQDVVTGLTLIFSDVLTVGSVVDIGGQTGRVERIGLRFTVLENALEQRAFVPNRNIAQISRYRRGHVRMFVDVQVPEGMEEEQLRALLLRLAEGIRAQHSRVVLGRPELLGFRAAGGGGWRFARLKFRVWPGQTGLIEGVFVRRVVAALRAEWPDYADWMVSVTYRGD